MTSATANYYNFSGFGVTYNFILFLKLIDKYSYKYKFYDTVEKKIRDCKIYSSLSHYKGNGFEFQRIIGPKRMIQSRSVFLIITKKLKPHLYVILEK